MADMVEGVTSNREISISGFPKAFLMFASVNTLMLSSKNSLKNLLWLNTFLHLLVTCHKHEKVIAKLLHPEKFFRRRRCTLENIEITKIMILSY